MTEFADDESLLQTIHANQTQRIIPYLKTLIAQGVKLMSALDDLKAADAALALDVMDAVNLIQVMHAAPGTVADADVEAVVANLKDLHAKLSAAAPPPPPPPAGP
jgi:pentose-5-phosphate-3-epimerase